MDFKELAGLTFGLFVAAFAVKFVYEKIKEAKSAPKGGTPERTRPGKDRIK